MGRLFISYAREDRAVVERLADAFELTGHIVWFDRSLNTGDFRQQIVNELERAEAVVVLWSARSRESRYVLDEAERGAARGVLVPVRLDASSLPLGFGSLHSFDLSGWSGSADDPRLLSVREQLERLVASAPCPAPRPRVRNVGKSLAIATALTALLGPTLAGLSALKRGATLSELDTADLGQALLLVAACTSTVALVTGQDLARLGLSHAPSILRRMRPIYGIAALAGLALATLAATAGVTGELPPSAALAQHGFVVLGATLLGSATYSAARAALHGLRSLNRAIRSSPFA